MLPTIRRRRRKPECSWTSGVTPCPTRILKDAGLLVETAPQEHWCAFHKPLEWITTTGFDERHRLELLRKLIELQAKNYKAINLPDFVLPAPFEISDTSLLGQDMPTGWANEVTSLNFRGIRCSGDLTISADWTTPTDLQAAPEILLAEASIDGSIRIDAGARSHLRQVNLCGAKTASIAITGRNGPSIGKIDLQRASVIGSVQIAQVRIIEMLVADSLTAGGTFALTECRLGTASIEEDPAVAFVDPIDRIFERAFSFGRGADGKGPSATRLKIDHCQIQGSALIATSAITEFLQITCTRLDGIVETDQATYPGGSVIFEFEQALGLAVGTPGSERGVRATERPFERAKLRRSFAALRAAASDPDQRARLLRLERQAMQRVQRVKPSKLLVWKVHEFLTDAGPNWAFPLTLLLAQGAFFWMLMAVVVPGNTLAHAAAVSAANSFTPFLSLDSMVSEHALTEVLLSFLQSALSAGLISSAVVAIRSDVEH